MGNDVNVIPEPAVAAEEEDSNLDTSEFVDNTQLDDNSKEGSSEEEVRYEDATNQDIANMEFLKQSWANIAEVEDADARLLADIENSYDSETNAPVNAADFKMVISKKYKKKQREVQNRIHKTRSKTDKTNSLQ
jgi:hypothetical protein